MNPVFFIFCEGETEEVYCDFLRRQFQIPVQVRAKIAGLSISELYIRNFLADAKKYFYSKSDRIFLMFDADIPEMLKRLQRIKDALLLISDPCVELWFLLHYQNQNAWITSAECLQKLKANIPAYKKGTIPVRMGYHLEHYLTDAMYRAKKLTQFNNPSSTMYVLIEALQEQQKARGES